MIVPRFFKYIADCTYRTPVQMECGMDYLQLILDKDLLSPREKEIVFWSAKGFTCQQIADQLFISKRTVETHRKTIMDKTSCLNFIEVVVYGLKERIITLDDL